MGHVEYSSNNSGGSFWLKDADWKALERAGWIVHWIHEVNDPSHQHSEKVSGNYGGHHHGYSDPLVPAVHNGENFLGASATSAAKEVNSKAEAMEAVREFEAATGQSINDQGCSCCGPPHSFSYHGDNGEYDYLDVYPTGYSASWD